jgi:hypothetical protein
VRGTEDSKSALLMLDMIWGSGVVEGRGDALNKGVRSNWVWVGV